MDARSELLAFEDAPAHGTIKSGHNLRTEFRRVKPSTSGAVAVPRGTVSRPRMRRGCLFRQKTAVPASRFVYASRHAADMACDGTFGGEPGGAEFASRPSYRIAGYIDPCESVPSEAQRLRENHLAFSLETRIHKRVNCTPRQARLNLRKAGMENLAAQHAR